MTLTFTLCAAILTIVMTSWAILEWRHSRRLRRHYQQRQAEWDAQYDTYERDGKTYIRRKL